MSQQQNTQVSYFAPGPAKLPNEVLTEVQAELVQYANTHVSVMELSHRSKDFDKIMNETEADIREVLNVPPNFKLLFLQGGGTGQFAAVPLNLLGKTGRADYFVTGSWSSNAAEECGKYGTANIVLPKAVKYTGVPPKSEWSFSQDAAYVYYCDNETVEGVEFDSVPEVPEGVPLVCDMSSNICTRPIDFSKYGLIYAGAQKNIGCAGVTMVIVREELLGSPLRQCPTVLDYSVMAKNRSLLNTPPTFAIYVLGKVFQWVKRNGGLKGMEELSRQKSDLLYGFIDRSEKGFYFNSVEKKDRSRMNVTFRIGGAEGDEDLEEKFIGEAAKEGLLSLKGHRSVGGMRASLYNAVTLNDVKRLVSFMDSFMKQNKN